MSTSATEPVTPAVLSRWAITAHRTHEAAEDAEMQLLETRADLAALAHVTRAREAAWKTYRALLDAGAEPVDGLGVPTTRANPLCALAQADTLDTRKLLRLLREAVAVAERVDAARGHMVAPDAVLLPGESRGTGWAETLSELALRLKIEVQGPADLRQGSNDR